jgi:ferredoxin
MMAYKISDACVNCGACESECPSGAISEKDGKRWVDPDKCVDCGSCTAACPVEAIAQ